jgi:hypothetical protein
LKTGNTTQFDLCKGWNELLYMAFLEFIFPIMMFLYLPQKGMDDENRVVNPFFEVVF